MFRCLLTGLAALTIFCSLAPGAAAQEAGSEELAQKARSILRKHCYQCHGVRFEVPQYNVMDRDSLLAKRPNEASFLVPHDLENSMLWQRAGVDLDMPPKKIKDRPTEDELATLKSWIEAGGEFPQKNDRGFISEQQVLDAIFKDLLGLNPKNVDSQRYFTLTHMYNNKNISAEELRLFRAAFVKLVNSLHRKGDLVEPVLIDAIDGDPDSGTIFRLDLEDVGWSDLRDGKGTSPWEQLVKDYPYGLKWSDNKLLTTTNRIEDLLNLTRDSVRYIRVDWFVAHAARPKNYHALLDIPETVDELEDELGINVESDFERNRLMRAGFAGSGVSKHNRLVDRHTGQTQYYYRSYDFGKSFGRGVIFRFPLGPKFENNNEFAAHAFEHDGGEIVWRLPNGMQGYMLVDKDGKRIDNGPIDIVRDLNEIAGTPQVVNAISCIGCHRHGLQLYEDSIRNSFALGGEAGQKLDQLYRDKEEMTKTLTQDRDRFLNALDRLTGDYLKIGTDADKSIADFAEPVSVLAGWYDKDLSLEDASRELSLEQQFAVGNNRALQQLGLGPLASKGKIPRPMWDSLEEASASVFQRAATALQLGQGVKN